MKVDGSDQNEKYKEKSETERLFDRLLFYKQTGILFAERFRITKELERLLPEDQTKFAEYLSGVIGLYENECTLDIDDFDPRPESLDELYYNKNTPLVEHLNIKRKLILEYLQKIEALWNNKQVNEIAAKLKETHDKDVSEIINSVTRIKNDFSLLENMTKNAIDDSSDVKKNDALKKSLDEMRNGFRKNGIDV